MEILEQFGFEPELFVAQIINFLILAYVFKRFLYKPLLGVLKSREDKIKQGLEDAQKQKLLLEKTDEERKKILKATRVEADSIIEEAKKIADEQKQRILEESRKESEKVIFEAKVQAALEMEKVEKRVGDISLSISQKILDNVLTSLFNTKEKKEILERAQEKLEKVV